MKNEKKVILTDFRENFAKKITQKSKKLKLFYKKLC
jgi:hypothetical protein